jgi:(p)ppGpp synthase/HD superfamily hydrolase
MNSPRFREALLFAAELHAEQTRKGSGAPYLSHLLAVAGIVMEHGGDEDEVIAALLHDAIEDQGGDVARQEVRRRFGERVTRVVDECTDTDVQPKPPWRQRKEAYLAHLPHASSSARLVSAADKLHNARTILSDYRQFGDAVWARFKGGRDGTLWYYCELVRTYRQAGTSPLVEELALVVDQLCRQAAEGESAGSLSK